MVEPLGNSVQVPYTPCSHCVDEVREGSVQSNHSELTSKNLSFSALKWFEKVRVYRYPTHLVPTVKMRFEKVRYSRTTPNSRQNFYTPCFLCTEVGSRRFEGVEPLGNSVQVPYTPCYHCEDEVREGSVQSNHSELTSKTSTHLAFSALKWFEKVRGGSRGLNHCVDEVREGSVQSNHSELTSKISTPCFLTHTHTHTH